MMVIEELIAPFIGNLTLFFILVFIGCAFAGDASVIFFSVLAYNYDISLWWVFWGAYFGTLLGDLVWFIIGLKYMHKLKRFKKVERGYHHIARFMEKVFKKNYFMAILIVKFLYGTRVITMFYLADRRMRLKEFMRDDLISSIVWAGFMLAIGYVVALGFTLVLNTFKSLQLAITLVIVLFFLFTLLQKRINKKLEILSEK